MATIRVPIASAPNVVTILIRIVLVMVVIRIALMITGVQHHPIIVLHLVMATVFMVALPKATGAIRPILLVLAESAAAVAQVHPSKITALVELEHAPTAVTKAKITPAWTVLMAH
jgi:hypothetical protein